MTDLFMFVAKCTLHDYADGSVDEWYDVLAYLKITECKEIRTHSPWWRHQMETFSVLLDICAGNSPVTGEFPTQRPVTHGFDVFIDLRQNKRLSKQWWSW